MASRSFILVAAGLVALLLAAGGVYAYDAGRGDVIAQGVRVGGIDVSGLTPPEAGARLRRGLLEPLRRPVVVVYGARRFALSARRARIKANIDESVDAAMRRSRAGSILSRTWRQARGQRDDVDLAPRLTYSRAAVARLVDRVGRAVQRAPRDASVVFTGAGLARTPGRDGRRLDAARLADAVRRRILRPGARTVRARAVPVAPRTTDRELDGAYPTVLTVDRAAFRLRLYRNLQLVRSYPIAVGQAGLETPSGRYQIQNKAVDPDWRVPKRKWAGRLAGKLIPGGTRRNPLKARWMGIYDGAGIHGTAETGSLGTAASHGCIRMAVPDVVELYPQVPVATPVFIA